VVDKQEVRIMIALTHSFHVNIPVSRISFKKENYSGILTILDEKKENITWIKYNLLKVIGLVIILLLSQINILFSQGELDIQPKILYKNEKSGGIYLNSNGLGAGLRYGQRINARNQILYETDLLFIKHPKEIRISNNIYSNRSFVFGKENTFFELRGMYGRQNEIFRKNDRGGVSVRYFFTGGPSIGFIKPIYYEVLYATSNPYNFDLKTEKFNTTIHQSNIYGRASFLKGVKEISIVPGVTAKAGFAFEYSRLDIILHSIEAGISADIFMKEIPIMATERNNLIFVNLFVSYRFGKYIDISEAALARRSSDAEKQDRKISRQSIRQQKKMEKEENYY